MAGRSLGCFSVGDNASESFWLQAPLQETGVFIFMFIGLDPILKPEALNIKSKP